jgi:hypothetical protein
MNSIDEKPLKEPEPELKRLMHLDSYESSCEEINKTPLM